MQRAQSEIGASIAALRKAKGLTQEQLAFRLGVSAPAVSKWETGSSCPDITLLCPLARALDTNVDTLLQFEETLSDREVTEQINGILQSAAEGGSCEEAEARLLELLHRYPNCTALKFNIAIACDSLQMFFPTADEDTQTRWRELRRRLMEEVRSAGSAAYWQVATLQLASMAVNDGQLDKAEALLRELPDHVGDPTSIWALYHLKKEEPDKALAITQSQLYKLVSGIQLCLTTLLNPKLLPEPERPLKVCRAYSIMAQTFGLADMSDGLRMEIYLRNDDPNRAADCFARYVETLTGPLPCLDADLFAPGLNCSPNPAQQAPARQMRLLLLKGLEEEERYRPLFEEPVFLEALEKLRASV